MVIVDDDIMTREVLALLAEEAGFGVAVFETGESALQSLAEAGADLPDIVLADMQMPGISGDSFARLLRVACGTGTTLLAMSGTVVPADRTREFDCFLLKPFTMEDVLAALNHAAAQPAPCAATTEYSGVLNRAIYDCFAQSMPAQQLRKLYAMSLDDADARIELMRKALAVDDPDAYRRAAHSIKGGCGMVGAVELAHLASKMEEFGPQAVDDTDPFTQFLSASARLRRILDALYQ
jgi:CheY-like chemotaxis protein/HPt (histidine-containing phosphotransfer) domain-containing protein